LLCNSTYGQHKFNTQVERLEVVETGRRRHWTDDEKLTIVLESLDLQVLASLSRGGIS
jgi:transposase